MPLTGVSWQGYLCVCVCVCVCVIHREEWGRLMMGVQREKVYVHVFMSLLELPGVTEQVPAWCHDSKHNWQAESHLAFATHTYSNIYLCAALSVHCVASAVLCYKDKALWRLRGPWEDESNYFLTGPCSSLSHSKCNILQPPTTFKKDTKITFYLQMDCHSQYGSRIGKIHFTHPHSVITL